MTYRIKTLNAISRVGLNRLPEGDYEVGGDVEHPDALLLRSASLHGVEIPGSVPAPARDEQHPGRRVLGDRDEIGRAHV